MMLKNIITAEYSLKNLCGLLNNGCIWDHINYSFHAVLYSVM